MATVRDWVKQGHVDGGSHVRLTVLCERDRSRQRVLPRVWQVVGPTARRESTPLDDARLRVQQTCAEMCARG